MSESEAWLATEDPTKGDLPATEFMGSSKDLSQTLEGDGSEVTE